MLIVSKAVKSSSQGATPPDEYDGIFDDFAELNLSKSEEEALTTVWLKAKETGYEYGVMVNNGVVGKPVTSNLPNAVKISIDGYGNKFTLIHSHTNATPFSADDLRRLLNENIDKIGVIGYNADAYMAYIGYGERPSIEEFNQFADFISMEIIKELFDHPSFFDWTIEERNYMAIREQAYRIVQHYGWTLEGGRLDVE